MAMVALLEPANPLVRSKSTHFQRQNLKRRGTSVYHCKLSSIPLVRRDIKETGNTQQPAPPHRHCARVENGTSREVLSRSPQLTVELETVLSYEGALTDYCVDTSVFVTTASYDLNVYFRFE